MKRPAGSFLATISTMSNKNGGTGQRAKNRRAMPTRRSSRSLPSTPSGIHYKVPISMLRYFEMALFRRFDFYVGCEPKLDFGHSGGLAKRVGDAVAERGAEFSHLCLSRR